MKRPITQARKWNQFYTQPHVAASLFETVREKLDLTNHYQFVEPSAGKGAFSRLLPPGSIAIDIDPQGPGIESKNFFEMTFSNNRPLIFIGNPPFGNNSKLARQFFNHAARYATFIAFILPRSFQKTSIINKLDPYFHLVYQRDVPNPAFIFDGKPKSVPAVFQIWARHPHARPQAITFSAHGDFKFVEPEGSDLSIDRNGYNAGRVQLTRLPNKKGSKYFISVKNEKVKATILSLNFSKFVEKTVASRSLAKSEILYTYHFRKIGGKIARKLLRHSARFYPEPRSQ